MGEINLLQRANAGDYRGYVASRPVRGASFPQQVQNLVIRDYAARRDLHYILSATEYAMPSCYMMLNAILDEIATLEGIIFFSIFMLPNRQARRFQIYERILAAGCRLHAALENVALLSEADVSSIEDLLNVTFTLPKLPMAGRYEKDETSGQDRLRDPFWLALSSTL